MKKSSTASTGKPKTFTLTDGLTELMDEMLTNDKRYGFLSYSEIVRRGILLAYREQKPAYKDESVAGKIKEKRILDTSYIDSLSDEAFATEVCMAPIFTNSVGESFFIFHNTFKLGELMCEPLAGVKDYYQRFQPDIEKHIETLKKHPLEEFYTQYIHDSFLRHFGIDIPVKEWYSLVTTELTKTHSNSAPPPRI